MALGILKQQLKMSQQLIMTPQLQQAIKLLQLSRLELLETIHTPWNSKTNPLLEESPEELQTRTGPPNSNKTLHHRRDFLSGRFGLPRKCGKISTGKAILEEYNTIQKYTLLPETDPNQEWPNFDNRI